MASSTADSATAATPAAAPAPEPFRRILTSHAVGDTDGTQIKVHDDLLNPSEIPRFGPNQIHVQPLWSDVGIPISSSHILTPDQITQSTSRSLPGSDTSHCQVTVLAPNVYVGFHRTSTVDYNILTEGSAVLITLEDGREVETVVHAGEIVIQRGTIHAWRAGPAGARWYTVMVAALPVQIGDQEGKELKDVDF